MDPERIEISESSAKALLERVEKSQLLPEDYELLKSILKSWFWLLRTLKDSKICIKELKKFIFGAKTEKTSRVFKKDKKTRDVTKPPKEKPKGHGRNGADAYTGAVRICVKCTTIAPGEICPECKKGKLYEYEPKKIVCVTGQAPINATIYLLQQLRCNVCGKWFRAKVPEAAVGPKYDPSSVSMMALLHYGYGFPFNRLDDLQNNLGIPLPSSTQWDEIVKLFDTLRPLFDQLNYHAALGELFHNDDTNARVLELEKQIAKEIEAYKNNARTSVRKGIYTSGIISQLEDKYIALFFTGRKHAGENLCNVISRRPAGLPTPIHMCDALSRNGPREFSRFLANCLCHGRREFIKLIEQYPDECLHILETIREVYKYDAHTKNENMTKHERLLYHQKKSRPIMDKLLKWLHKLPDKKNIEPNGRMGKAIKYMTKNWDKLTLFLNEPGAPLDNNICERAIKVFIRYRNNSFFYKTEKGAQIGDFVMSLIHTCKLNSINAFDYLNTIAQHAQQVADHPERWLPWNYDKNIA